MADVQDVKIPYEILIRFGDDGKPRGAHAQYIRRVSIDGELLKEEIGAAEPLDLEGFPTSQLMSDSTRDALAEVTRLQAALAAANDQIGALTGNLNQAGADAAELQNQLSIAHEQIMGMHGDLAQERSNSAKLQAENDALTARISGLQSQIAAK